MDSADNKVHYLPVTAKASTEYVLTDGINNITASTSDQTNLNELVNALKQGKDMNHSYSQFKATHRAAQLN